MWRNRVTAGVVPHPALKAGRRLNRAAGILAAAVLLDSAMEHYRGSFHNKAMVAPLISSSLSLLANKWLNLFYGAPIAAPAALSLSGMLGYLAERSRENEPHESPTILGLPAGRVIAAITAVGLCATAAEAGLFHFRGAYHDKAMFLPVTIPPAAAAILADAAGPRWLPRGLALQAIDATDIWREENDTCHLNGTARMGDDPRTSVVNADCRSWDIPNLWICDGSVFPTVGGVNPSLTIQAIACRTADRIRALAARGDL